MPNCKRFFILSLCSLLLLCTFAAPAEAYNLLGQQYYDTTATYSWMSGTPIIMKTAWETAAEDWADTGLVELNYSSSSSSKLGSYNHTGIPEYGSMMVSPYGQVIEEYGHIGPIHSQENYPDYSIFEGRLNVQLCGHTTVARSVANHELGHLWGLNHVEDGERSIMDTGRDRLSLYLPQRDDENGVEEVYY